MSKRVVVLAMALAGLAGCGSWDGDASVTLTNGSVYQCPRGLWFQDEQIVCRQKEGRSILVSWRIVAGFRAGAAR